MSLHRSHAIVGVVGLGVGALLASAPYVGRAAYHQLVPYWRTHPGSVTRSCAGATWTAVAAVAPGSLVTVNVMVSDPQRRDWQVGWQGGRPQIAKYDDTSDLVHAFATLGDLDNGEDRHVRVRPVDSMVWCRAEASLR